MSKVDNISLRKEGRKDLDICDQRIDDLLALMKTDSLNDIVTDVRVDDIYQNNSPYVNLSCKVLNKYPSGQLGKSAWIDVDQLFGSSVGLGLGIMCRTSTSWTIDMKNVSQNPIYNRTFSLTLYSSLGRPFIVVLPSVLNIFLKEGDVSLNRIDLLVKNGVAVVNEGTFINLSQKEGNSIVIDSNYIVGLTNIIGSRKDVMLYTGIPWS